MWWMTVSASRSGRSCLLPAGAHSMQWSSQEISDGQICHRDYSSLFITDKTMEAFLVFPSFSPGSKVCSYTLTLAKSLARGNSILAMQQAWHKEGNNLWFCLLLRVSLYLCRLNAMQTGSALPSVERASGTLQICSVVALVGPVSKTV